MKKHALSVAIVSQILAILTHLYLVNTHYGLKYGQVEGKSLCNINDYLNCDIVNLSPYSIFLGVPIALWGVLVNLTLLVILLLYRGSAAKSFFKNFATLFAGVIALASLVMGVVTLTKVSAVCMFCLSAYVLSFVTLLAVLALPKESMTFGQFITEALSAAWVKYTATLLVAPVALSFLINSMAVNSMAKGADRFILSSLNDWKTGVDVNLTQAQGLTKGADIGKAKMVIVEFADFQCIHCKHAQPVLSNFVRSRPDVTLIYQSFPLDGNCNPAENLGKHDGRSCELAKAVYCGWKQNKGWELHDWAFDNFGQAELSKLTDYAQSIGVNLDEFRICRDNPETLNAIIEQARLGDKSGVKGTPSIFVNGRLLPRGNVMLVLEAAYDEIKKSH